MATVTKRELDTAALEGQVRGQVIAPGDPGYEEARQVHNAMIDRRPALIVRAADIADVISVVNFARERLPDVPFHEADMTSFDLGSRFDAVVCMFSSIGYARTEERLGSAVASMARHLDSGGVLVVEPWLTPEVWLDRHVGAVFVDEPELKIARMNVSQRDGDVSIVDFQYLVGTPDAVEHFSERHELGLFTVDQHLDAFKAAGLEAEHDPEGPMGRGLYVAIR